MSLSLLHTPRLIEATRSGGAVVGGAVVQRICACSARDGRLRNAPRRAGTGITGAGSRWEKMILRRRSN